jgi:hypothetical protein
MNIRDILEYDLYEVVDNMPWGNYLLSIFNEGNKVVIFIEDANGSAVWAMDKAEFLSIGADEGELERLINSILYYNYIERDEEECSCERS